MNRSKWLTNSIVVCFIATLCCALWGSAFPCIKIGYQLLGITSDAANSQILFAGMRFTLAGILVIFFGSCFSGQILIPKAHTWPKIIILSLFQTIIQYIFFYIGLSHTSGVKASIIEGTSVFIALLIASLFFHQEMLSGKKLLGCVIGFIGVIIVNLNKNGLETDLKLMGEGFVFLSTVSYALSSVCMKHFSKNENTVLLSGYQFIAGGIVMTAVGFFMGGNISYDSLSSVGMLFYLAMVSAAAYSLWGILLQYNPVSKVAVYGFMTPVFGVLLSTVLLQENQFFGIKYMAALILVSVGITIVNVSKNNMKT